LRKIFRAARYPQWEILDNEIVDEVIFKVPVELRPHDLRRHAATYASRSGTPIEIVSKVILRHSNLSTTQRYLGKVSDVEALLWIC
jgi:integrase